MGYYDDPQISHRTGRIAIISILLFLLGSMFFAYKTESCKATPANCRDEFFELKNESGYRNEHSCSPGATAEVVSSPPAPKPGVICHCSVAHPAPPPDHHP